MPELDLHRRSRVNLEPQQSLHSSADGVIIDEQRRDMPVEDMNQNVAAGNDLELIPVILLDVGTERITTLKRPELTARSGGWGARDGRRGCLSRPTCHRLIRPDIAECAARREKRAPALLVQHPGVLIVEVDVRLITLEDPLPELVSSTFGEPL